MKTIRPKQVLLLGLLASLLLPFVVVSQTPPAEPKEIIIKALVDGTSELNVTTNGFQWRTGIWAKPGRHGKKNEPTYINDMRWIPQWSKPDQEYGADTSDVFPWPVPTLDLDFELLAIGDSANATNMEVRSAPTTSYGAKSFNINIPDPELGSRWYIFALIPRVAPTNKPAVSPK